MKSLSHALIGSGILFLLLSGSGCMSNGSSTATARQDDAWCSVHPKQCDNQDWCAKHSDKCTSAAGN